MATLVAKTLRLPSSEDGERLRMRREVLNVGVVGEVKLAGWMGQRRVAGCDGHSRRMGTSLAAETADQEESSPVQNAGLNVSNDERLSLWIVLPVSLDRELGPLSTCLGRRGFRLLIGAAHYAPGGTNDACRCRGGMGF